jgi:hypothetical protein
LPRVSPVQPCWHSTQARSASQKAQINCETIPAGSERTDGYIGLGMINRQKSEIAADAAQQQTDSAIYRQLTGRRPKTKWHRAVSDR